MTIATLKEVVVQRIRRHTLEEATDVLAVNSSVQYFIQGHIVPDKKGFVVHCLFDVLNKNVSTETCKTYAGQDIVYVLNKK